MPKGTEHVLEGLLLRNRLNDPVLEVRDGGTWRLSLSVRLEELLGRRVRLVGTRIGFDLLDVHSIHAVGAASKSARRG